MTPLRFRAMGTPAQTKASDPFGIVQRLNTYLMRISHGINTAPCLWVAAESQAYGESYLSL